MVLLDGLQEICRGNYSNSNVTQLSFSLSHHQPKQTHSRFSSPSFSTYGGSMVRNYGTVTGNKTRIRWTQDLHDKFLECVNRLGGADSKLETLAIRTSTLELEELNISSLSLDLASNFALA